MQKIHKKIAIIGAGPAGLVAAKSCLEYGLTPVIFEKSSRLGGVWSDADNGSAWTGMHTNLSKWSCMFSDFPWPDETQEFPCQSEVANYLKNYADAFNVTPHIRFNSEVAKTDRVGDSWLVDVGGRSEHFDAVIIASGFFAEGTKPNLTGQKKFAGDILHSSKAHPEKISCDKRIVVCGGSFSGYELAAEFAKAAQAPVAHVLRTPSWVLKRQFPDGQGGTMPVDFASYSREKNVGASVPAEEKIAKTIAFFKAAFGDPKEFHPDLAPSENTDNPPFVVISDNYLDMVEAGKIIPVRGEVKHYNRRSVCVDARQEIPADTIVWATGYRASLPFMGADIKSKIDYRADDQFMPSLLHEAVWPKDIENLGFVGFYRGPYFAVMELQARWVAGVFAGEIPAPTTDEIDAGIADAQTLRNLEPRPQFPYGNYVEFADRLALKVGCYPDLPKSDSLFEQVNEGFFLPSHFRLMGHGANRAVVEQVIGQIPYIK